MLRPLLPLAFATILSAPADVAAQAGRGTGRGTTPPPARGTAPSTASTATPVTPAARRATLLDPARAFWRTRAPETFHAQFETSKGSFTVEVVRTLAPNGADRFYNLARAGYFDDTRFYRVLPRFVAQFGIAGDPAIANLWGTRPIPADSVRESNVRGTISYAQFKPTDRTTNLFVNLRDNTALDTMGFAPIGRVIAGMEVVDSLYTGYGEFPTMAAPMGDPKRLYAEPNKYLDERFPNLDRILRITVTVPGDTTGRQVGRPIAGSSANVHRTARPTSYRDQPTSSPHPSIYATDRSRGAHPPSVGIRHGADGHRRAVGPKGRADGVPGPPQRHAE
jgi:peptidyl-prolyl cis-trans isomerase A (cyclophilin A)